LKLEDEEGAPGDQGADEVRASSFSVFSFEFSAWSIGGGNASHTTALIES
jgi:hypothetical protein